MVSDLSGGELIGGNPQRDVSTRGLPCLAAGEEGGVGAGVIAGAVTIGEGFFVIEVVENRELIAQSGQWLERFR